MSALDEVRAELLDIAERLMPSVINAELEGLRVLMARLEHTAAGTRNPELATAVEAVRGGIDTVNTGALILVLTADRLRSYATGL